MYGGILASLYTTPKKGTFKTNKQSRKQTKKQTKQGAKATCWVWGCELMNHARTECRLRFFVVTGVASPRNTDNFSRKLPEALVCEYLANVL